MQTEVQAIACMQESGISMRINLSVLIFNYHIVPNPDGGWDVKRENAKRSSGHYGTKKEAMDAGRRMSINQGTELIPHRKDGTIQNPDSHGNDPCPPQDKK